MTPTLLQSKVGAPYWQKLRATIDFIYVEAYGQAVKLLPSG